MTNTRAILSILICIFLPFLLAVCLSPLGIGPVEVTLLYVIVLGCVIYSWRRANRTRERHREKQSGGQEG